MDRSNSDAHPNSLYYMSHVKSGVPVGRMCFRSTGGLADQRRRRLALRALGWKDQDLLPDECCPNTTSTVPLRRRRFQRRQESTPVARVDVINPSGRSDACLSKAGRPVRPLCGGAGRASLQRHGSASFERTKDGRRRAYRPDGPSRAAGRQPPGPRDCVRRHGLHDPAPVRAVPSRAQTVPTTPGSERQLSWTSPHAPFERIRGFT